MPRRLLRDKENQEIQNVIEEEYRSLVRIAEALENNGMSSINIATPLGDFSYLSKKEAVQVTGAKSQREVLQEIKKDNN